MKDFKLPFSASILLFTFIVLSCSKETKSTEKTMAVADTILVAKVEVPDSSQTEEISVSNELYQARKEDTLSITDQNILIDEGNWLGRSCMNSKTYLFTTDKAFLSSDQKEKLPPSWKLKNDTLLIYKSDSIKEEYIILSLTTLKIKLRSLQSDGKYLTNCDEDELITLYRDEVVQTITEKDVVGRWGFGELFSIKADGTFEYDIPPSCYASGVWSLENGKLALSFTKDPCTKNYIEALNNIVLTNYSLTIKTQSQREEDYRTLYRDINSY